MAKKGDAKDGEQEYRMCVDYKEVVNPMTVKDRYPMPNLDSAICNFHGVAFFSVFDVSQGFHQIPMAKNSMEITAFRTHIGLFEFTRMPFGLANAPSTFQRLMDTILAGLIDSICRVYMDDVVVFTYWMGGETQTIRMHLHHCDIVLARFRRVHLKLKRDKLKLLQETVTYIGFELTRSGIRPTNNKIEAITHYTRPNTIRQLRAFVGFLSFYRRFIKNFASIASPLYNATSNETKLKWTDECQESFDKLRNIVTKDIVLSYPNYQKTFYLDTDACDYGVGGVLSQEDSDAQMRPLCFYSKHLSSAQLKYATIQKECLALVLSVRFFRIYLYGKPFVAYTDHQPLIWFIKKTPKSAVVHRWFTELSEYDFELKYRKGTLNGAADGLSRIPEEDRALAEDEDTPIWVRMVWSEFSKGVQELLDEQERREIWSDMTEPRINALTMVPDKDASEMRRNQLQDPLIAEAIRIIETKSKPPAKTNGRDAKAMLHEWKSFSLIDGVLYRKFREAGKDRNQFVVPTAERGTILQQAHDAATSGHFGVAKTMAKLRTRFYWPLMKKDVQEYIRTCATCQQVKTPGGKPVAPLVPIRVERPFQIVTSDFLGDFPKTSRGNQNIIVFVDKFTKYVVAYATPDVTAETFAVTLMDFICRHSMPEQLLTDQGAAYESRVAEQLCELLDIQKLKTTPFHPQCNGQSENANRTIVQLFRTFIEDNRRSATWDYLVPLFSFAHNVSANATTGEMPFEAVHGREPRIPLDLFTEVPKAELIHHSFDSYVTEIKNRIKQVFKRIQVQSDRRMRRAKIDYDRRVRGGTFEVGDKVYLLRTIWNKGMYHKFQRHWLGPYEVIGRIGLVNYVIQFNATRKVIHSNLLKKAHDRVRFVKEGELIKLGQRRDKDLPGGEQQLIPKKRGRPPGSKNKPRPGNGVAARTILKRAKEVVERKRLRASQIAKQPSVPTRRSPRIKSAFTAESKRLVCTLNAVEMQTRDKPKMTRKERRAAKLSFRNTQQRTSQREAEAKLERARDVLAGAAESVGHIIKKMFA